MIKHIACFALIICIAVISIKAACPTTLVTPLSTSAGSFCESGFDLTQFASNVTADVDKADYDLVWQTENGAPVPDPTLVIPDFPPPQGVLGDFFDYRYELLLVCTEDPSISISGGFFTATIFPSSSLLACTDEITSNDCDGTISISNQCNVGLTVEYESSQGAGDWSSTPPTFPVGSSGNQVSYRVYYPGGENFGCVAIGIKMVNCPLPCQASDCGNLILNPFVINGVFLDENFNYPSLSFCDGNTYNIDQNRYGEWDTNPGVDTLNFDMPQCGKAVWYQENGTEVDPNITFTHDNNNCEPIVLNYNLEIECVADANVFEPAGSFEATVFPNLTNFFKRPADPCDRQLDITCTSTDIIVEYSTDGITYDETLMLPPLVDTDPPQDIYYKVTYINGLMPPTSCPNLDGSFTADCNATCPTDLTPINQPIPSICGVTGSVTNISSTLDVISTNPEAIFILTDANNNPINVNNDQMVLDYAGSGCDIDVKTISIRVECSTDPSFSEDGGAFSITVYPPIDASLFKIPTDCDPEITFNCPPGAPNDLIVEYSVNGAFTTQTPPDTLAQNDLLTYTITSQGNTVIIGGCFFEGTYTCNDACNNAGIGSTETLCASDSQVYGLDQFLTDPDPSGSWTETSTVPSSGTFDPTTGRFSPLGQIAGTYVFEYSFAATTDCPLSTTTVTINIEQSVDVEITPDATVCNDGGTPSSLDLNDLVINSEIPGTWFAPDNTIIPDGSTMIDFTGLESDNYIFTYNVVRDASPCGTVNLEANVVARECLGQIAIPSAFTPNGQNSTLYILNTDGVEDLEFSIYNRWGQRVYHSTDYNLGWDGTFNRVEQEIGVYVYFVKVNYRNGESEIVQGNVVLIR